MYLFQKAGKNLLKNKGRNTIMLVLLSIVATAAIVALTIWNVAYQFNKETENYYAGEVSLTADDNVLQNNPLTAKDYKDFIKSDYLRSYVFFKHLPINIHELHLLDEEYNSNNGIKSIVINARLYGLLDEKSNDDFSYAQRVVTEGHFPKSKEECIISSNLAGLNDLSVGDVISFNTPERGEQTELTISGVFSDSSEEYLDPNHRGSSGNTRNDIIITYDFFTETDRIADQTASFLLKDSSDMSTFQSELYSKGLSEDYTLRYDIARYTKATAQINQISVLVLSFILIIALVCISIIFLVNLSALRERKYEIGVFRAIGMPKRKVVLLLMGEMLMLALIALVIAIIAGAFINPSVVGFFKSRMTLEMPSPLKAVTESINGGLSVTVIAELITLTLGLVILAGSATIGSIMRFDPMKILSERN